MDARGDKKQPAIPRTSEALKPEGDGGEALWPELAWGSAGGCGVRDCSGATATTGFIASAAEALHGLRARRCQTEREEPLGKEEDESRCQTPAMHL